VAGLGLVTPPWRVWTAYLAWALREPLTAGLTLGRIECLTQGFYAAIAGIGIEEHLQHQGMVEPGRTR
jgi:hypothetical protein